MWVLTGREAARPADVVGSSEPLPGLPGVYLPEIPKNNDDGSATGFFRMMLLFRIFERFVDRGISSCH
jgi:hypothetical protein